MAKKPLTRTGHRYSGSSLIANVAYDIFTYSSSAANGSPTYEVMIWLAALGGAGPISATGQPIATPSVAGKSWRLYYGLNGSMKVYSFVATSNVSNFSGDLKEFFNYLARSQGFPTSQWMKGAAVSFFHNPLQKATVALRLLFRNTNSLLGWNRAVHRLQRQDDCYVLRRQKLREPDSGYRRCGMRSLLKQPGLLVHGKYHKLVLLSRD